MVDDPVIVPLNFEVFTNKRNNNNDYNLVSDGSKRVDSESENEKGNVFEQDFKEEIEMILNQKVVRARLIGS